MSRAIRSPALLGVAAFASLLLIAATAPAALARQAFVVNFGGGTVTPVDIGTDTAGAPIPVGNDLDAIAITPDGRTAYVADELAGTVSVIDTGTDQLLGTPIPVGLDPAGVAITPNGLTAYVTNALSNTVSVVDTATRQPVGSIKVGSFPVGIAITPGGLTAYVSNAGSNTVSVISTLTDSVVGAPITVGAEPLGIAVTPDGRTAYVANGNSKSVSVIDTGTNEIEGAPIKVGKEPGSIAVTPDGRTAYVANDESNSVSVIDTASNQVTGPAIKVGPGPTGIAIIPNGRTAYVAESGAGGISPIDLATGSVGSTIATGEEAFDVAIVPAQTPAASFTVGAARAGAPVSFDGSASSDFGGTIASDVWSFGDGQTAAGSTATHTYASPGTYQVTLTVDDGEGCPGFVYTGQTASCDGPSVATATQTITVAAATGAAGPPSPVKPRVRVTCPKSAKPGGCRFTLEAVAAKPRKVKGKLRKPKPESAVAKATLKAGQSKPITLEPKPKFAVSLAAAKSVLVRETRTLHGVTKTLYRRLPVIG